MKPHLILIFSVTMLIQHLTAQEVIFPADKNIKANSIAPMVVDNDIIGYFACILKEMSRTQDTWNLLVMDINFKIIRDVDLYSNGKVILKQAYFNGSHFCFAFTDLKSLIQYHFYDITGNRTGMTEVEDIKTLDLIKKFGEDSKYVVPYTGIIRNGLNPKDEHYIEFFNNEGDLVWRKRPKKVVRNGKESNDEEEQTVYHIDTNYVILEINKPGLSDEDLKKQSNHYLSVLDIKTGKELFVVDNRHEKGFLVPLRVYAEENKLTEFGQFFEYDKSGVGFQGNKSLGMYVRIFDRTGHIIQENLYQWKDPSSDILNWKPTDPEKEKYDLWIHEVIKTLSGKYYVISEIFISSHLIDMIVFEFSPDLVPIKSYRFEKDNPGIMGIPTVNAHKMGIYMESIRAFDYKYTAGNADKSIFNTVFLDTKDGTRGKNIYEINAIALDRDQNIVNPKIVLKNNPDKITILPAKTGYVAVIEFFIKEEYARLFLHKFDL